MNYDATTGLPTSVVTGGQQGHTHLCRLIDLENEILKSGVAYEEGEGDSKTEQTKKHRDPSGNCSADYWFTGQNCAWWATTMFVDVGKIRPEDINADRFIEFNTNKPWNRWVGIYTFADPTDEGGNRNRAQSRPQQVCKPGCFKSDLPRPKDFK